MSDDKQPVTVRIDLRVLLDAMIELQGDEYCMFRDAVIDAVRTELTTFEELATK